MLRTIASSLSILLVAGAALAQQPRPMSPDGSAAAQVLGKWVTPPKDKPAYSLGGQRYEGGKWIEITSGRPLQRGRDLWGSGTEYGKSALVGAPIWRAGANVTTRLKTEVPLRLGGKTVPAGEYSLFIDLVPEHWTLVVSTWPAQQKYDPNDKTALWGSYGYTPEKDVVRVPMTLETMPHAMEQLTWAFLDMKEASGTIALMWGNTMATVPFEVAQ